MFAWTQTDKHRQGEETQGEDSYLPAKGRCLEQILPSQASEGTRCAYTLTSDLKPPQL